MTGLVAGIDVDLARKLVRSGAGLGVTADVLAWDSDEGPYTLPHSAQWKMLAAAYASNQHQYPICDNY